MFSLRGWCPRFDQGELLKVGHSDVLVTRAEQKMLFALIDMHGMMETLFALIDMRGGCMHSS